MRIKNDYIISMIEIYFLIIVSLILSLIVYNINFYSLMVDKNGNSFYGIEQYFDPLLRGKDGKIIGRSSSWIGNVGANDFQIDDVIDGNDNYLSIDIGIQKEIELLVKKYQESLKADSVSVLVLDPFDGSIKASANYPSFNSNDYNDSFDKVPL